MALFPTFGAQVMPALSNNSDSLLQLGAGLLGGRTAQEQLAGGIGGFAQARQLSKQKNKTLEFLRQNNPDLAAAVESGALSGGDAYKLFYQQKLEAQKPKNNYLSAGGSLYDLDNKQWITPPQNANADQESFYGNPIPIQTPQGIQYGQIGSKGTFKPIDIGQGNTFAPAVKPVDTGTGTTFVGPGGVQVGAPIQKDLAGAANQKAVGEGQGAATVSLPGAAQLATQVDQQINDLKTDPYLPSMVGSVPYTGGMIQRDDLPDRSPESQRVRSKINQLKGGSFLQARSLLKGGGAITDFEGQKADNAFNRMNTAQNLEDFNKALDDFNDAVKTGVAKLQQQAQGNFGVGQSPSPSGVMSKGARPGVTSSGIKFSVEGQ